MAFPYSAKTPIFHYCRDYAGERLVWMNTDQKSGKSLRGSQYSTLVTVCTMCGAWEKPELQAQCQSDPAPSPGLLNAQLASGR